MNFTLPVGMQAVFFIIFEDDVSEIYFYKDGTARFDVLHFGTLKGVTEEFDVCGVYELAFEGHLNRVLDQKSFGYVVCKSADQKCRASSSSSRDIGLKRHHH